MKYPSILLALGLQACIANSAPPCFSASDCPSGAACASAECQPGPDQTDASQADAAQQTDASQADAAQQTDASQADAHQTDASQTDASQADAARTDAAAPCDLDCPVGWQPGARCACSPPPPPACDGLHQIPLPSGDCSPALVCPESWSPIPDTPGCQPDPPRECRSGSVPLPAGACTGRWRCPVAWEALNGGYGCRPIRQLSCPPGQGPGPRGCAPMVPLGPCGAPPADAIVVGAPDGLPTLSAALDVARESAQRRRIFLRAGVYPAQAFDFDVDIEGECPRDVLLSGATISASVTLERMTIVGQADTPTVEVNEGLAVLNGIIVRGGQAGVVVARGQLFTDGMTIRAPLGPGVVLHPDGSGTLNRLRIDGATGIGINALGGTLDLTDVIVSGTQVGPIAGGDPSAGLSAAGDAHVSGLRVAFQDNAGYGILLAARQPAEFNQAAVTGTVAAGDLAGSGLAVLEPAGVARCTDCYFSNNAGPITALGATLEVNRLVLVEEPPGLGLAITGGATLQLDQGVISGLCGHAIAATGQSQLVISNLLAMAGRVCSFEGAEPSGLAIAMSEGSTGTLTDSALLDNEGAAVAVLGAGTELTVERVGILHADRALGLGWIVGAGARLSLTDALIVGSLASAVDAWGPGTVLSATRLGIADVVPGEGIDAAAVLVRGGATATIEDLFVVGGEVPALVVRGEGSVLRATRAGLFATGEGTIGATASESAHLELSQSSILTPATAGVLIESGASAVLSELMTIGRLGRAGTPGLRIREASARLEHSWIQQASLAGIYVTGATLDLEDVRVERTAGGERGSGGDGVAAVRTELSASGFVISDSDRAGLLLLDGSSAIGAGGRLQGNAIGLAVDESSDAGDLQGLSFDRNGDDRLACGDSCPHAPQ